MLEKGIAVHHSGVTPIFREMIEILFKKKYIRLLFATETFAVGINMPTRSVVFTSLKKYTQNGYRCLFPHEYTQMAGRAGRRGIDTVGYIFHLNNFFINRNHIDVDHYRQIVNGTSQEIQSKINISPSMILRYMYTTNKTDMDEYLKKSMMYSETNNHQNYLKNQHKIIIKDYYIWAFDDGDWQIGGKLHLINDDSMGRRTRITCSISPDEGEKFMMIKQRMSVRIDGVIGDYSDQTGLKIDP